MAQVMGQLPVKARVQVQGRRRASMSPGLRAGVGAGAAIAAAGSTSRRRSNGGDRRCGSRVHSERIDTGSHRGRRRCGIEGGQRGRWRDGVTELVDVDDTVDGLEQGGRRRRIGLLGLELTGVSGCQRGDGRQEARRRQARGQDATGGRHVTPAAAEQTNTGVSVDDGTAAVSVGWMTIVGGVTAAAAAAAAAAAVAGVPLGGLQGARAEATGGIGACGGTTVGWATDGVVLTPLRFPNLARRASCCSLSSLIGSSTLRCLRVGAVYIQLELVGSACLPASLSGCEHLVARSRSSARRS